MDRQGTEWASRRCAELILQVAGGTLHPGVIDVGRRSPERPAITLRLHQIRRVLGIDIDRATAARILRALGLEPLSEDAVSLSFRPPSWRSDLEREIDLIEEVARIHGYEHIPEDSAVPLASTSRGRRERVEGAIRDALTGAGFDEAVTFSLVDERLSTPLDPGPAAPPLRVEHSSRRRESALRQSLVPSLLAARWHNESHGQFDADLFEIANVYIPRPGEGLPHEPTRLAIVAGREFRGLKGVVEGLIERLHVAAPMTALPVEIPLFIPGRAAALSLGGTHLGYLGEVDPARLEEFELREACSAVELELDVLLREAVLVAQQRSLPPFPAVVRDLSLEVARDLPWGELSEAAVGAAGRTLEAVHYLDTFQGGNLPEDQQSVHFSMVFRHPERTLTGEEVEAAVRSVVEACRARFNAQLRG
jgi:phenylalanyl-tRNA synthetase beta chain